MPNLSSFDSREQFNEWYKKYRQKPSWKKYRREYLKRWRENNGTTNDKARMILRRAILKKEIMKSPCIICGDKKVEAHHSDYHKPLEVIWLCMKHHRKIDVLEGKRQS